MKHRAGKGNGIWAVVLAAGASRRMGKPKLLLQVPDGRQIVRCVVEAAIASEVDGVIVVTSRDGQGIRDALSGLSASLIENPHANDGQSASLHAAVKQLLFIQARAGVFLLADQPEMRPAHINAVVHSFIRYRPLLAQARYQNGFGHPVLFSKILFQELLSCTGDEGGRSVVAAHQSERYVVDLKAPLPFDIDTLEDYEDLLHRLTLG